MYCTAASYAGTAFLFESLHVDGSFRRIIYLYSIDLRPIRDVIKYVKNKSKKTKNRMKQNKIK